MIPFAPPSKTEPVLPQLGDLSCHCSSKATNKGPVSMTSFCKKHRTLQMSKFPDSHLYQLPERGIENNKAVWEFEIGNSVAGNNISYKKG